MPTDLDGLIEPCVSYEEKIELTRVPSEEEIRRVVFNMNPLKAPGLDDMPGLFYKHYWLIVGEQLVAAVLIFFREGWLLREMNHTFITLIPKVQGAHNFNQFRPI